MKEALSPEQRPPPPPIPTGPQCLSPMGSGPLSKELRGNSKHAWEEMGPEKQENPNSSFPIFPLKATFKCSILYFSFYLSLPLA